MSRNLVVLLFLTNLGDRAPKCWWAYFHNTTGSFQGSTKGSKLRSTKKCSDMTQLMDTVTHNCCLLCWNMQLHPLCSSSSVLLFRDNSKCIRKYELYKKLLPRMFLGMQQNQGGEWLSCQCHIFLACLFLAWSDIADASSGHPIIIHSKPWEDLFDSFGTWSGTEGSAITACVPT